LVTIQNIRPYSANLPLIDGSELSVYKTVPSYNEISSGEQPEISRNAESLPLCHAPVSIWMQRASAGFMDIEIEANTVIAEVAVHESGGGAVVF
jgi:hypothetical protein